MDQNGKFTTKEENSTTGGIFVTNKDIGTIKAYIEETFPGAMIINKKDSINNFKKMFTLFKNEDRGTDVKYQFVITDGPK